VFAPEVGNTLPGSPLLSPDAFGRFRDYLIAQRDSTTDVGRLFHEYIGSSQAGSAYRRLDASERIRVGFGVRWNVAVLRPPGYSAGELSGDAGDGDASPAGSAGCG
jgi:hypothetical protein